MTTIADFFIGQEHLIDDVTRMVRMRADRGDTQKSPLVALFTGVSGVGKTHLGRIVASLIHGKDWKVLQEEGKFMKLDMSAFAGEEDANFFFGSAPGFEGGPGPLYDVLVKHRNAVILLDEVEKAHPKIVEKLSMPMFDNDGQAAPSTCS